MNSGTKLAITVGAGVLVVFGGIFGLTAVGVQREMSVERQNVDFAVAQVQNVLTRQAELLPNMAEVAKGYAKHEQDTFAKVAAFRSKMSQAAAKSPEELTKTVDGQKELAEATAASAQALLAFNSVREAYPQLQANDNYKRLMVELEGSINRVTVERRKWQQAIKNYNLKVVQFPKNLVAAAIGYGVMPFYTAPDADQRAPKLNMAL